MNRILKCDKYRITQYFSSGHPAIDIVKYYSETCPIIAHSDGVVVFCQTGQKNNPSADPKSNASYGNCVKIKHIDGYYTLYAHMAKVYVKKGQTIKQGQEIGYMGNTGRSFGAHLHFEVRKPNETKINPQPYINADLPDMGIPYQSYDNKLKMWLPKVKSGSSDYAGDFGNGMGGIKIYGGYKYRVHLKGGSWLDWVTKADNTYNGYAGIYGKDIDGVQIYNVTYRVHIKGGGWLSWVNKVDNTSNGYAGIYGKVIDGIQIK